MKLLKKKGTTNTTLLIFVQDSSSTTGAGLAGVTASMLTAYYARVEDDNDVAISAITLSDLTGTGTVHTDGGLEEISSNMPGWYRLDIPDATIATGADVCGISLIDSGSNNIAPITIEIQLVDIDFTDSVRMGLTALPNASADGAGGLPISDAGGLDMDATDTNVSAILVDTGTTLNDKIDVIDANVDQIETAVITNATGTDIAADIIAMKVDTAAILVDTGTTLDGKINTIDGIVDSILVDTAEIGSAGAGLTVLATATALATVDGIVDDILVDTGTTLDGKLNTIDGIVDDILVDTGTTLDGKIDTIDGIVDAILVDTGTTLDAAIAVIDLNVDQIETAVITNAAGADVAADIIAMKADTAAILTDTGTTLDTKINTIDGIVDAILVDTAEIGTAGAGLSDLGGMSDEMKAEVNAEVVNTLATDTYAEPGQGTPLATTSLSAKIGYLYKGWRNEKQQTSSTFELYNDDAATVDQKATVSDDGSITTIGEIVSGP